MAEKAELSDCADRAGAQVLGLKVEVDKVRGHRVHRYCIIYYVRTPYVVTQSKYL